MTIGSSDTKTTDTTVRKKLIASLREESSACGVIEEFEVANGKARADIVTIVGNKVHAFEIKSDVDTLYRLPNQVRHYSKIFSTVTLVVGESHVVNALYEIPDWWGVIVARNGQEGVILSPVREATDNPLINFDSVSNLLRKQELINILGSSQAGCSYWKMSKRRLIDEVRRGIESDTIVDQLSRALMSRGAGSLKSVEVAL